MRGRRWRHGRVIASAVDLDGRPVAPVVVGEKASDPSMRLSATSVPRPRRRNAEGPGVAVWRPCDHGHAVVVDQLVVQDLVTAATGSDLNSGRGFCIRTWSTRMKLPTSETPAQVQLRTLMPVKRTNEPVMRTHVESPLMSGGGPAPYEETITGRRGRASVGKVELGLPRPSAAEEKTVPCVQPGLRRSGERPPGLIRALARTAIASRPRVDVVGARAACCGRERGGGRRSYGDQGEHERQGPSVHWLRGRWVMHEQGAAASRRTIGFRRVGGERRRGGEEA